MEKLILFRDSKNSNNMKKLALIILITLLGRISFGQTVSVHIQPSTGDCLLQSSCEENIICYDISLEIVEPNWMLRSYNIWVQYPSPPLLTINSDNSCVVQNGGDTEFNPIGRYRISGLNGSSLLSTNGTNIIHSFCLEYSQSNQLADSLIRVGGTSLVHGFPLESTLTLVNTISGETKGLKLTSSDAIPIVIENKQSVEISGGWSGISGNLIPGDPDIVKIMEQVDSNLVLMYNLSGKIYYPAQNVNTILNWDYKTGYIVKVNDASSIHYCGLESMDKTINLKAGWNVLPVLSNSMVQVDKFFRILKNNLLIVKEIAGNKIYYPAYSINTLGFLTPGKAYFVNVLSDCSLTFSDEFNIDNMTFKADYDFEDVSPWNKVVKTPESHVFCFGMNAAGMFETGDLIGAFDQNGNCSGVSEVLDINNPFTLTVFSNDATTSFKEGLEEGELISFKLWRPSKGFEFSLQFDYSDNSTAFGNFITHGISLINHVTINTTGVTGNDLLSEVDFSVYPNPTYKDIRMKLTGDVKIEGQFVLTDAHGQIMLSENLTHLNYVSLHNMDLSEFAAGAYYLRIKSNDFYAIRKVVKK